MTVVSLDIYDIYKPTGDSPRAIPRRPMHSSTMRISAIAKASRISTDTVILPFDKIITVS